MVVVQHTNNSRCADIFKLQAQVPLENGGNPVFPAQTHDFFFFLKDLASLEKGRDPRLKRVQKTNTWSAEEHLQAPAG